MQMLILIAILNLNFIVNYCATKKFSKVILGISQYGIVVE